MEFDPRTDQPQFNPLDEGALELARAAAPSEDARIRHLELRRVAELSRIAEVAAGLSSRRSESPAIRSSSSSTARWQFERRHATARRALSAGAGYPLTVASANRNRRAGTSWPPPRCSAT